MELTKAQAKRYQSSRTIGLIQTTGPAKHVGLGKNYLNNIFGIRTCRTVFLLFISIPGLYRDECWNVCFSVFSLSHEVQLDSIFIGL